MANHQPISVEALSKQLSQDRTDEQDNVVRSIFMDKCNLEKLTWFLEHSKIVNTTKYTKEDILELIDPNYVKDKFVSRMLSQTTHKDFFVEDYDYTVRCVTKAKSCKERNIPFLLTFSEYKNILKTKKCKYTGVEMNDIPNDPHQLTLERIDNKLPYVKGNVVAVCNFINSFKSVMLENSEAFWKDDPEKMLKDITRMVGIMTKKNIKPVEIKQKRGVK